MKSLSVNVKTAMTIVFSLLLGYAAGKLEAKFSWVNSFNGYLNLSQLDELVVLNLLRSGKNPEAINFLESKLSGGFIGRSGENGGIQVFREQNAKDAQAINDLNKVVLGINEYFCKYNPREIEVFRVNLLRELESIGRQNEICNSNSPNKSLKDAP